LAALAIAALLWYFFLRPQTPAVVETTPVATVDAPAAATAEEDETEEPMGIVASPAAGAMATPAAGAMASPVAVMASPVVATIASPVAAASDMDASPVAATPGLDTAVADAVATAEAEVADEGDETATP